MDEQIVWQDDRSLSGCTGCTGRQTFTVGNDLAGATESCGRWRWYSLLKAASSKQPLPCARVTGGRQPGV